MNAQPPFSSVRESIDVLQTRNLNYQNINLDTTPVVSIISSFYNDARYFEDTYKSIINQTFQNYEWIIVDDCSTDFDSINIFNSLEQKNSQIKTFCHQVNKGPAAGRNKAASYARGKYLFFLDTDDIIEPTYIEKCVLFLEIHPEFSIVNSYSVGFQEQEYWWNKGFNTPNKFITENLVTGRVLYRKTDFESLGGYDESLRYAEDWDLWLKALSNYQKAFTIPEYLDFYRRRESGLSKTALQDSQRIEQTKKLLQSRYSSFFKKTDLADVSLSSQDRGWSQKTSSIDIKNLLNCDNKKKKLFCFLPNLKSEKENVFFLELLQKLKKNNYSITIGIISDIANELHSEFYKVTPDLFYLGNIFNYFDWISIINYIILSRDINLISIYNSACIYYLLPHLIQQHSEPLYVGFNYVAEGNTVDYVNTIAMEQYSSILNAKIVNFERNNNSQQQQENNNTHYLNLDKQLSSIESTVEFLETILQNSTNPTFDRSTRQNTDFLSSQETLVWIQKYLEAKYLHDASLVSQQEIEVLNAWNNKIIKERDIYKKQVKSWIRTAKSIQLDLNRANLNLDSILKRIDKLGLTSELD